MINLHRYYKDNKDDINSSIMELACDLAAARLMNEHGQPFESFVEADDPDDPEGGTHYKKEFQDEFDRYYDEQYDRIARLMRFDFNADDGVAHNNAVGELRTVAGAHGDYLSCIGRRQATGRQAEGALSHAGKTGAGIDAGYRFPFR